MDNSPFLCILQYDDNIETFKRNIIERKIDINRKDKDGRNILYWACILTKLDIVKLLLSNCEMDINIKDIFGYSPVHYLTLDKSLEILEFFVLERGIDIDMENKAGYTLLEMCTNELVFSIGSEISYRKSTEIIKFLIESGADYQRVIEGMEGWEFVKQKTEKLEQIILEVADIKVKYIRS